jgi:hypothetical protein
MPLVGNTNESRKFSYFCTAFTTLEPPPRLNYSLEIPTNRENFLIFVQHLQQSML